MTILRLFLVILSVCLFGIASLPSVINRERFVSAGLACFAASFLPFLL